jgi:hypothetical protein
MMTKNDTIFIREETPLPMNCAIESEAFVPGWRVVRNLDRSAVAADIEAAQWHFFYLTGEAKVTVFGRKRSANVRRAVKFILSKQAMQEFNSLEVTNIAPRHFLGIPFLRVTARSRHIQQRMSLIPTAEPVLNTSAVTSG